MVNQLIEDKMIELSRKEELNELEALESEELYKLTNKILVGDITPREDKGETSGIYEIGATSPSVTWEEAPPVDAYEKIVSWGVFLADFMLNVKEVMDVEFTTYTENNAVSVSAFSYPKDGKSALRSRDVILDVFDVELTIDEGNIEVRTSYEVEPIDFNEFRKNYKDRIVKGIMHEFKEDS